MKFKELIGETYNAAGLSLINLIALSGPGSFEGNISYGPLPRHRLDIYRLPEGESRPWIVFFYGGNWRSGNKSDYRFVADTLNQLGFNVVIPDYRLYPLVRYKEIIQDAALAMAYVFQEIAGSRPVFIMGHSAGAQIGSLLCLDQSLQTGWPLPDQAMLAGFVGLAGPYDFYPFTEADHWDLFGPANHYLGAQAVNHVHAKAPPLLLLHGETDRRVRRGHSKSLMEKALAAGGAAERVVYPGMGHIEILLSFTRLHRNRSPVVTDIADFLESQTRSGVNELLPNLLNSEIN